MRCACAAPLTVVRGGVQHGRRPTRQIARRGEVDAVRRHRPLPFFINPLSRVGCRGAASLRPSPLYWSRLQQWHQHTEEQKRLGLTGCLDLFSLLIAGARVVGCGKRALDVAPRSFVFFLCGLRRLARVAPRLFDACCSVGPVSVFGSRYLSGASGGEMKKGVAWAWAGRGEGLNAADCGVCECSCVCTCVSSCGAAPHAHRSGVLPFPSPSPLPSSS